MIDVVYAGQVPSNIREKVTALITSGLVEDTPGWKKIRSLRKSFSFKLSRNYRILCWGGAPLFVCNHDIYERKIRNLRKGSESICN